MVGVTSNSSPSCILVSVLVVNPVPESTNPFSGIAILPTSFTGATVTRIRVVPSDFNGPSTATAPTSTPAPLVPVVLPLREVYNIISLSLRTALTALMEACPAFGETNLKVV